MKEVFPDAPSYEELEEMKTPMEEYDDITEFSNDHEEWYNEAPKVAARLIIQVAQEHDGYRSIIVQKDDFGRAHAMLEYDPETYDKFCMGLSANQGGAAENIAQSYLKNND